MHSLYVKKFPRILADALPHFTLYLACYTPLVQEEADRARGRVKGTETETEIERTGDTDRHAAGNENTEKVAIVTARGKGTVIVTVTGITIGTVTGIGIVIGTGTTAEVADIKVVVCGVQLLTR